MEFEYLIDNELRKISLEKKEEGYIFTEGEYQSPVDIKFISPNILSLIVEGRNVRIFIARDSDIFHIYLDGQRFVVREPAAFEEDQAGGEGRSLEDDLNIKAPMPGKVIKVCVSQGDAVRKNQTLAIVEAMKMENEIKSPLDAAVKAVHAADGDLVDSEKILIELEKSES
ncbi:MAG: hypothetical protein JXB26_01270 [Candidatus Aminicenantes bacterium]|nr:hypothetical protein [Candidatus Aminicenantes bacterium]